MLISELHYPQKLEIHRRSEYNLLRMQYQEPPLYIMCICMWVCVAGWLGGALGSLSLLMSSCHRQPLCTRSPCSLILGVDERERGKAWLHVNDNRFRGAQSARALARSQAWRHFILLVAKFSPLSLILSAAAAKCTHQCGQQHQRPLLSQDPLDMHTRGLQQTRLHLIPDVECQIGCDVTMLNPHSFVKGSQLPASFRCFLGVSMKTIIRFIATKICFLVKSMFPI
jgi:hypothetical protein